MSRDGNRSATTRGKTAGMPPPCSRVLAGYDAARERDPWVAMISGLTQFGAPVQNAAHADTLAHRAAPASAVATNRRAHTGLAHAPCVSACARNAVVTFVERISPNAVSITWRDSTGGNYREQRWVLRAARSRGVCALTGATISRGDFIYHPVGNSRVQPANLAQMIRAEALEQLE